MAEFVSDSTKMEVARTSRGFAVARGVDRYAAPYSIQDSSLAEEAAIWLGSDAETGGRAHLTQDMAAGLIPLLQRFVATGSIACPLNVRAAPPAMDREAVERALTSCRDQFAFYAREHTAAGKSEKAATNARFAKIADDALSTLSADAIRQGEGVERDVTFEVWQDEICFATSTDEADARHYLEVYGQDGPAKPMRAVTVRTEIAATPASHASDGGEA